MTFTVTIERPRLITNWKRKRAFSKRRRVMKRKRKLARKEALDQMVREHIAARRA